MNRKRGLYGFSVVAGVTSATALLVAAGAGTAAPVNTDAAYGVHATGATSSVGPTPGRATSTGAVQTTARGIPSTATNGDFSIQLATVTTGPSSSSATVTGFHLSFPSRTLNVATTCRNGRATVVATGAVNQTFTQTSAPITFGTGTTITFHVPATKDDATGAIGAVVSQPGLGTTIRLASAVCAPKAATPTTSPTSPTSPAPSTTSPSTAPTTPTPTGTTTAPSPTSTTSAPSPTTTTPTPTDTEPPTPSPTTTQLPVTG
ncbi:MAG TPA: hypothetical protein VFL99_09020 [Segeticoccus sp.]|uniref:hypothetical protein n=1 Tax=Segeticoccus sp. TaxID=2706531 RepID=UPI002D7EF35F|nr:hypothetical protein [Segeticoccus sp.]HET8600455.1 hypothetical protein [Segeticoccus sp.]